MYSLNYLYMLNIEFKEGDINCDLFSLTKYIYI